MFRRRGSAGVLAAALLAGSCATGAGQADAPPVLPALVPVAASLAAEKDGFGRIAWEPCPARSPADVRCARVTVPSRYDLIGSAQPEAVAVAVRPAGDPDRRIGALFVNPGGPGVPARPMVFDAPLFGFGDEILDRFDLVAVDPRGVGGSTMSFRCEPPGEVSVDHARAARLGDPAAGRAELSRCLNDGSRFLHTEYVARDMDLVRAALGETQISYYGASYGATLGVWYATLFGNTRVRAMAVDGAINLNIDWGDPQARQGLTLDRLLPIESRLRAALDACTAPECPFRYSSATQTGSEWFAANADRLEALTEEFDGFGPAPALAVLTGLYSEAQWPLLHQGIADAVHRQDFSILEGFALLQLGEGRSWSSWSLTAHVNCLDEWALAPDLTASDRIADTDEIIRRVEESMPLLAAIPPHDWRYDLCPFYEDMLATPPNPMPLDGGLAPVLVIGNLSDPVTPISHSAPLAASLLNGRLLSTRWPEHVAYVGDQCVKEKTDRFLLDLEFPDGDCIDEGRSADRG